MSGAPAAFEAHVTEISYLTPGVKGFKDRSAMLLVVGILFIVAGALSGCMMAMTPLGLMMPRPPGTTPVRVVDVVGALLIYASLCAALLALGIGCVRKRRWVRPLIIVFGWIALTGGAVGMILWAIAAPQMGQAMRAAAAPGAAAPPPAFVNIMVAVITLFAAFVYLIVPATLLWLFRKPDVQATLEHYDVAPRWSDAVPVPVLGLCALLLLGALWALMAALQSWFFVFGLMLAGAAARVVALVVAGAFASAMVLAFRLRPVGWYLAMALFVFIPLAWIVTLLRHDTTEIYRAMGMDETQLRVAGALPMTGTTMMALGAAAFALGTIAFAVRVRKHFVLPPPQSDPDPEFR